jgi:hypothetical protein
MKGINFIEPLFRKVVSGEKTQTRQIVDPQPYEGIEMPEEDYETWLVNTPVQSYSTLIDKISGKGAWDSNPFVWVYDFELISKNN